MKLVVGEWDYDKEQAKLLAHAHKYLRMVIASSKYHCFNIDHSLVPIYIQNFESRSELDDISLNN